MMTIPQTELECMSNDEKNLRSTYSSHCFCADRMKWKLTDPHLLTRIQKLLGVKP